MPYPRQTLTALRASAMQDITASDLPNADGFLRRAVLRVIAWVLAGFAYLHDGYLDWISLQSTPFTATGEYMEGWAALAPTPVLREAPTFASGPASWPGVVDEAAAGRHGLQPQRRRAVRHRGGCDGRRRRHGRGDDRRACRRSRTATSTAARR